MTHTIKEVIVVEGNHDKARILEVFPEVDVVITNGYEVPRETIVMLKRLNKTRGLILMLDPDGAGERIRRSLVDEVGSCKHVFIKKHLSHDKVKNKIGIEHVDKAIIKNALSSSVRTATMTSNFKTKDLIRYGLMGSKFAHRRRLLAAEYLEIGESNAKAFLHKINMFGIEKDTMDEVMTWVNQAINTQK